MTFNTGPRSHWPTPFVPRRLKTGRPPVAYDIGDGRSMTVKQLCQHTGCGTSAMHERLRRGLTGDALLAPAGNYRVVLDVGHGERMTVTEIAERLVTAPSTISERMRKGLRGRALLAPVADNSRRRAKAAA